MTLRFIAALSGLHMLEMKTTMQNNEQNNVHSNERLCSNVTIPDWLQ